MSETYARQSFLGPDSEDVLQGLHVGIVGYGGGGSHIGQQVAHVGIGHVTVVDPDTIEDSNLNRLVGGTRYDVFAGSAKTSIARRTIAAINPASRIVTLKRDWRIALAELRRVHVLMGCVDSFAERANLEAFARRFAIPYIDIGMNVLDRDGWYSIIGQVVLSCPGTLCMRCMGVINDHQLEQEERARQYGAAGSKPQVIWPNGTLASTAVGLLMQLVTPWSERSISVAHLEYDGNRHTIQPAPRLKAMVERGWSCSHYQLSEVGDPLFHL